MQEKTTDPEFKPIERQDVSMPECLTEITAIRPGDRRPRKIKQDFDQMPDLKETLKDEKAKENIEQSLGDFTYQEMAQELSDKRDSLLIWIANTEAKFKRERAELDDFVKSECRRAYAMVREAEDAAEAVRNAKERGVVWLIGASILGGGIIGFILSRYSR